MANINDLLLAKDGAGYDEAEFLSILAPRPVVREPFEIKAPPRRKSITFT
jgi:hypothetical protein